MRVRMPVDQLELGIAPIRELAARMGAAMRIKPAPTVSRMSGGNQQKLVLGKWLAMSPRVLLLDEPTRGIDVGAKFEIYKLMTDLVREGKTIIMISSELPELLGMCDRIYVMSKGRITGELNRADFSQENVMKLATRS